MVGIVVSLYVYSGYVGGYVVSVILVLEYSTQAPTYPFTFEHYSHNFFLYLALLTILTVHFEKK